VTLFREPGREVVRAHGGLESGLLGSLNSGEQGAGVDLFV
jgi:hypothetical protein